MTTGSETGGLVLVLGGGLTCHRTIAQEFEITVTIETRDWAFAKDNFPPEGVPTDTVDRAIQLRAVGPAVAFAETVQTDLLVPGGDLPRFLPPQRGLR